MDGKIFNETKKYLMKLRPVGVELTALLFNPRQIEILWHPYSVTFAQQPHIFPNFLI